MLRGYLTTTQAAARLELTQARIRQLCIEGDRFPNAFKVGRDWLVPVTDIEVWIQTDRDRRYKRKVPRPKDDT